MPSSRMLRRVTLVRTEVSVEYIAPIMAIRFTETSVLTRATRRNTSEDDILHSQRHENLKSYIALPDLTGA
jgi:hypothetical protein